MMPLKTTAAHATYWYLAAAVGFLFLLQSAREMISSVYYYNLVELGFSPWILVLLVFLAPLASGRLVGLIGWRGGYIMTGSAAIAARMPMAMGLDAPFHLIASCIAFAASSTFISILLALHRREREMDPGIYSAQGLTASVSLSLLVAVLLTTLGGGVDISIIPRSIGFVLSPLVTGLLCLSQGLFIYLMRSSPVLEERRGVLGAPGSRITGGAADSIAPAVGFGAFIFLSLVLIPHPQVAAVWNDVEYRTVLTLTLGTVAVFIMSLFSGLGFLTEMRRAFSSPKGAILGNVFLVVGGLNLVFFGIPHPLVPVGLVWLSLVNLWMIVDALTDSRPFAGESVEIETGKGRKVFGFSPPRGVRTTPARFGRVMAVGTGLAVLLILLMSISLNWAYVPGGSIFEGKISTFLFLGILAFAVSGFACSKRSMDEPSPRYSEVGMRKGSPTTAAGKGSGHMHPHGNISGRMKTQWLALGSVTLAVLFITGIYSVAFLPCVHDEVEIGPGDSVIVVTYNVHQGFCNGGRADPVPIYEELRELDPDVIFLQESESLRPNSGSFDLVRYLAWRLDMYSIRGPSPDEGVFGVSILSRFPLSEEKVFRLHSDKEPRVAVTALADIGPRQIMLMSTHLTESGGDAAREVEQIMEIASNSSYEVIIGGDFNLERDDPFMEPLDPSFFGGGSGNNTTRLLKSAYHCVTEEERWRDPTYPARGLDFNGEHIDYIFVSQELVVLDAGIENGKGASDHRPVWARIRIP